jgi:hypothetical protein
VRVSPLQGRADPPSVQRRTVPSVTEVHPPVCGALARPKGSGVREARCRGLCFGGPVRADEQRMARDLTEKTSPVSTLASPKSEKLPAGHLLARTDGAEALMCWRDEPENGSNEPRRRRRRAHAAQSGQSPHLDPCQCRPGGSPAVGPRACSVGLESAGARNARLGALARLSAQTSRERHRPDREDIACEYIDVATSDLPPCRSPWHPKPLPSAR